ncbi:MAG: DUF3592 domain-containing protein [Proteobacteria bacterium]|nr:DUF3592 domain-containing protein [Pseudomonadota bacterium]
MNAGGFLLLCFGLFWSGITLTFDSFIARTFYHRLHAQDYAGAPGRVTRSEIIRTRGSKGSTSYRPKIHFSYTVNGTEYTSEKLHYGEEGSSDARWAEQIVKTFPVGQSITARYDVANPGDAVLLTGLEGSELFLALFLTPFNCIMLALWCVPLFALKRNFWPRPAGVPVTQRLRRTHVNLATVTPFGAAVLALGGGAFGLIFVVGFSAGFNPSVKVACLAWGILLAGATLAYVLRWLRLSSGVADLVLDTMGATLTLPRMVSRTDSQVSFHEVKAVVIEQIANRGQRGGTTYSYAPTLQLHDGRAFKLADWYDEPKAKTFTAWLRGQLGLPAAPA